MRFRSRAASGGRVYAVAGTNTVSFGIDATAGTRAGLLGFAVERVDLATGERHWLPGFKVFRSLLPHPVPGERVSTFDHPMQSFLWDDFTCAPDHRYTYRFQPLKGTPAHPDRSAPALSLTVRTEPATSTGTHDVFFNRGVASSQYYTQEFGDTPIADLAPEKQARALAWLSRDLDEALLAFVDGCAAGDRLLGCFYEFRYRPVADALVAAIGRGVDVRLIVDGKVNEHTDDEGFHESFPREENLRMLAAAQLPMDRVVLRQARRSAIAHNKFMVKVVGGAPAEVWTGSTNLSLGGIHGQTNVGHHVRDAATAAAFVRYWDLLATDPGGRDGDPRTEVIAKNKAFRAAVAHLSPVPADLRRLPRGTTSVFSPRPDATVLDAYAALLDSADDEACITLAFTVAAAVKEVLRDNTAADQITFLLLEKRDRPDRRNPSAFVRIDASNNVYQAWGSFLRNPVYQWAAETNAGLLGLNQHVSYIHSKFLLVDPLGRDPRVVTGSANFSAASCTDNDENMLVVRGDRRVADIYLTEFNRLFNHYYFRSVTEARGARGNPDSLFLTEDATWLDGYAAGGLKSKRLALYTGMAGFTRA
ncbi:phospholipase D-like domain-containing protein [Pseudonocardia sp. CA-107938]|uniref:phospholipase D-like domain-containing protein n=1 Tax=Pseudonocardia sp. CA-107938 TaxID=3240021 RepID=UPI003D8F7B8A